MQTYHPFKLLQVGMFQVLVKIRVLVPPHSKLSQSCFRYSTGNGMNVLELQDSALIRYVCSSVLLLSNAFSFKLKEKLAIACYLNLDTEIEVWQNK